MILYNFRPGKYWCGSRYRDRSCSADIGILLPFTHKAEYCGMPQEFPFTVSCMVALLVRLPPTSVPVIVSVKVP